MSFCVYLKTVALMTSGTLELLLMVSNRLATSLALMRKAIRVSTVTSNAATTTP